MYTLFIKFPFTICPLKLRFNLHGVQALIRGHLTPPKHPHDLYLPSHTVVKVTVSLQHGSVNPFWWVTPSHCIKHLSPLTAVQNEVFWWSCAFFPQSHVEHAIRAARGTGCRRILKCFHVHSWSPASSCAVFTESALRGNMNGALIKVLHRLREKENCTHTWLHACTHKPTHLDSDGEETQQQSEKPSVTSEIRTWSLHQSTAEQSLGLAAKVSFTSSSQCGEHQGPLLVYALIFYHSKPCP